MTIPKVIHFCWFGKKNKSKQIKHCIESWKKHLSGYKFIEWNEKNSDLSHPFVQEAYKNRKWAFVADYVRLDVLSRYGGIYLDTDMMLLKNLDVFLTNNCFFGAEDKDFISCGIIGSIPNSKFIKQCKLSYSKISFTDDLGAITIPRVVTKLFKENYSVYYDFRETISNNEIVIYPPQYFYPFPFENKSDLKNYKNYITADTFAVHLWSSSWIDYSEFHYFRNSEYFKGFQIVFEKLFKEKKVKLDYMRKIISTVRESYSKN